MHGDDSESGASRAARHAQLARIREAAKKADDIANEAASIKTAAEKVDAHARALRAEVDDAIAKIQASLREHLKEETGGPLHD